MAELFLQDHLQLKLTMSSKPIHFKPDISHTLLQAERSGVSSIVYLKLLGSR